MQRDQAFVQNPRRNEPKDLLLAFAASWHEPVFRAMRLNIEKVSTNNLKEDDREPLHSKGLQNRKGKKEPLGLGPSFGKPVRRPPQAFHPERKHYFTSSCAPTSFRLEDTFDIILA